MRVTAEHLTELREKLTQFDTTERRAQYLAGAFPRADAVKDLNKRYRWDLYWTAVQNGHTLPDSTNGYNDAHIDTALRHIVPSL